MAVTAVTDSLRARDEGPAPADHWRVYAVLDVADLTARGLAECTCGVRYPVGGGTCPNAAEARREVASGAD